MIKKSPWEYTEHKENSSLENWRLKNKTETSTYSRNQSKKITSRKQTSLAGDNENLESRFQQEEREMENPDCTLKRHQVQNCKPTIR
jgi:hypothetical protein